MVETAFSCMIMLAFFFAFIEIFSLINNVLNIQIIAREGAREASITGSIDAGHSKAEDFVKQYYGSGGKTEIHFDTNKAGGKITNVVCNVSHPHTSLKMFAGEDGGLVVNLNAQAVYPWWDENL